MATRKRKRQEAFEEQSEPEPPPQTEAEKAQAKLEKEQEIWEVIREAHFEAVEQLPLTLQRQLSLMRQLDEQTSSCAARLLPFLNEYLEVRRRIASKNTMSKSPNPMLATPKADGSSKATVCLIMESTLAFDESRSLVTRDMIKELAVISEEFLRAAQEKVNLAQANYDSVERHIQLLEQAIKEQEASLSADPSNPGHIHLPELVIPQFRNNNKPGRKSAEGEVAQVSDAVGESAVHEKPFKTKRDSGRKRKQEQVSPSFTITLPASQSYEELLYCYCNRVSFGEMIACDGPSCQREWFHLGCVGLPEPPEGEWYCEDCNSEDL